MHQPVVGFPANMHKGLTALWLIALASQICADAAIDSALAAQTRGLRQQAPTNCVWAGQGEVGKCLLNSSLMFALKPSDMDHGDRRAQGRSTRKTLVKTILTR